jgi:hypothetical protein
VETAADVTGGFRGARERQKRFARESGEEKKKGVSRARLE